MKYTMERLPESRVAIDVEIEQERVEKALNRAARQIAKQVRIPGFRPGKAPRYIIEARYGRSVLYEEATDELVREAYREILGRGEFEPVAEAQLDNLSLEPFSFRMVIPVRPTVVLGDYTLLRFTEEVEPVGDEAVEAELLRLQDEQTVWVEPDPARPAQSGDRLILDMVGFVGEREIERNENGEVILGSEHLPEGFSSGLLGAEIGQTLEIEIVLPEDLEDDDLAGQPAQYTVTVQAIKEAELPPLDDEFAASFGQEDTLEEMRARLRREREEAEDKAARDRLLDQMIGAIVEQAQVDMPEALVEEEAESSFRMQAEQLQSQQLSMEQFLGFLGRDEEEYRAELREQTRERLRRSLVFRELIRAEDLTVEEADLEREIERIMQEQVDAEMSEEDRENLRQLLSQPQMQDNMESTILSRKLEELLLSIARGQVAEPVESGPAEEDAAVGAEDPVRGVDDVAAVEETEGVEDVEETEGV